MPLTKCPECGDSVSDQAKACPHCGYVPPSALVQRPDWRLQSPLEKTQADQKAREYQDELKAEQKQKTSSAVLSTPAITSTPATKRSLRRSGLYLYGLGFLLFSIPLSSGNWLWAIVLGCPFLVAGMVLRHKVDQSIARAKPGKEKGHEQPV
jgi:hypothetical protein